MSVALFRTEFVMAADSEVVYRYLTEADLLLEWIAAEAEVDRRVGGAIRWRHANGDEMIGRFVELVPNTRIAFRYGWADAQFGLHPEASLVEIDLEEEAGRTTLRLCHSLLPSDSLDAHKYGWTHFLRLLSDRLSNDASS